MHYTFVIKTDPLKLGPPFAILCPTASISLISYVVIQSVTVDGYKMPYSLFVFTAKRLYDYINYTFESLKEFKLDYERLGSKISSNFSYMFDLENEEWKEF